MNDLTPVQTAIYAALTVAFSRASTATYTDIAGVVQTAAINVARTAHYVNGVLQPTLYESAATNHLLYASDFSNPVWIRSNCTVTTGIADPAGGTTACTITGQAGGSIFVQQIPTSGQALVRTGSVWLRRRTGTDPVQLQAPDGTTGTVTLTAAWQRFSRTGASSTGKQLAVVLNAIGDAVDIWNAQVEDGSSATSTIPTTANPVTRAADFLASAYPTYDAVPQGVAKPYIVIGEVTAEPDEEIQTPTTNASINLHTWSATTSKGQSYTMLQFIRSRLDGQTISGTWACTEEMNEVFEDQSSTAAARLYHGIARYEARVG